MDVGRGILSSTWTLEPDASTSGDNPAQFCRKAFVNRACRTIATRNAEYDNMKIQNTGSKKTRVEAEKPGGTARDMHGKRLVKLVSHARLLSWFC